jgi:flavin-dependent thymidylate synthase
MFEAEPMPFDVNEDGPRVHVISITPDPLGHIAAMSMMYEGRVARSLADVTHKDRHHYFEEISKTHLKAPFESVHFHFLIEGVTRSFTHQMVRQRTAVFAQESLRFAVKETIDEEVALPPSLRSLPRNDPRVLLWKRGVNSVDDAYHALVSEGVPAEDARGLLPHNITTRLHYVTNLRALQEHAGNRLCTQAQFEWRVVWARMLMAIREYNPLHASANSLRATGEDEMAGDLEFVGASDAWQYEAIAGLFKPVCYLTGKCEFKADFDRKCRIRSRVDDRAEHGAKDSSQWDKPLLYNGYNEEGKLVPMTSEGIDPAEWLTDPAAAR